VPPSLVLTLRDTTPAQNPDLWLSAIGELEHRINAIKNRGEVIEGLRARALAQLPPFLLSLLRPLKSPSTGLSTNLPVLQTSLLLKYQPFYTFLLHQSPRLAKQVERGYVNAARAYYETGMRRYIRALGTIKARTVEKVDLIGAVSDGTAQASMGVSSSTVSPDLEGDVVLAYMADDKDYVSALYRKANDSESLSRLCTAR
jgi:hypothetical protein